MYFNEGLFIHFTCLKLEIVDKIRVDRRRSCFLLNQLHLIFGLVEVLEKFVSIICFAPHGKVPRPEFQIRTENIKSWNLNFLLRLRPRINCFVLRHCGRRTERF